MCVSEQTSKQNRTRDMEIKNKLTVTRGEGIMGKKGKGQVKDMYKGPMDKANGVGRIESRRWGWVGQGRIMGGKWG